MVRVTQLETVEEHLQDYLPSQCWCGHLGSSTGLLGPDHTSQVSQVASIFSRPHTF